MATISKSLNITAQGIYTLDLNVIPDGSTVTPVNDIQTWLHCANIWDKTYTTITQVLSDGTTFNALVQNTNAVKYMVRSTTWANSVTSNSSAMTYIGANSNCANSLISDSTWLNAICTSTYFESVLTTKVPTMISNTAPSGRVIATSENWPAYYAFDGNAETAWGLASPGALSGYLAYMFASTVNIKRAYVHFHSQGATFDITVQIKASNDGVNWVSIGNPQTQTVVSGNVFTFYPNVATKYKYWAFFLSTVGAYSMFNIQDAQFYGRA